jgi:DNA-binding NtrC family response regulator
MSAQTEPSPPSVLIVDDDDEMRAVLRVFLEHHGYRVIDVSGAAAALLSLDAERPDVAILDKEMPGLNGLELLPLMRDRYPHVPVIFVTAFGGSRVAEEARRRGAFCYVEKPFRVAEILDIVQSATRHHQPSSRR